MKYEFTGETILFDNITLNRIRATKSFDGVCENELGGFIQHHDNLSHIGDAWV